MGPRSPGRRHRPTLVLTSAARTTRTPDALLAGLSGQGPHSPARRRNFTKHGRNRPAAAAGSVIAVDWLSRPAAPEAAHYDQLATLVRSSGALPGKRPLVIGGGSVHDAGAAATQELAFTLAAFVDCADQLTDRGLDAKTVFANTELSLAADTNFFFQVAKFRALRLLAGQVGAAYSVRGAAVEVHGRTARWNKFRQDAYNNMLRATLEAMAAVLGGCDTLTVEPYNVRFAEPDALSRRVARNVHAILREESYLAKVADPAAGAYYIENTTYALAGRAWELFQAVEGQGGYWAARQNGFLRREIEYGPGAERGRHPDAVPARALRQHVRAEPVDHPAVRGFLDGRGSNAFYRRNLAGGQKGLVGGV
jgi:hypothetical protein